jgi:DNA-binding response OmpR family regulator
MERRGAIIEDVASAGTRAEGIAAARAGEPDVGGLDLRTPDQSGYDVCKTIRDRAKRSPEAPVLDTQVVAGVMPIT